MAVKESNIMRLCMVAAAECGAIVWRNNVGVLEDSRGKPVRYGLCNGSSDLIGIFKGRFLAVEIKRPGERMRPEQELFIDVVRREGGIAFVATSPEEFKEKLNGYL